MIDPGVSDFGNQGTSIRVVHISADFPDPVSEAKTPVVRTLLDLSRSGAEHTVYSLNRRSFASKAYESLPFARGKAVTYRAPPRGVLHKTMLLNLGDRLAAEISSGPRPDLLMGHKLTVEGIAVRRAASLLGIPYGLSIQGNTDTRILAARPDLRRHLARVFHEAAIVFPFAPWALQKLEEKLGRRAGPTQLLPCPTDLDQPVAPRIGGRGLVSLFHLRNQEIKNLAGMCRAMELLENSHPELKLEIIGGGSEADLARCRAITGKTPSVVLAGGADRSELVARLNGSIGLVMPSLRESFGLAFVEALFAGIPVIYPAGAAIDGYFSGKPFALRVDARDPEAIAAAMRRMVEGEAELKMALAEWQQSDHASSFHRIAIGRTFSEGLRTGARTRAFALAKGAN